MNFYRRNLPHWQPPEAEYFVTFRLADSLPKEAVNKLKNLKKQLKESDKELKASKIERSIFQKYEKLLENDEHGPVWLQKKAIAQLVAESIEYRNEQLFDLYAYCIMPNHVHLVFKHIKPTFNTKYPIIKILASLKRYTARKANQELNREGQFWQHESFDRVIRNQEELESTIRYVLNNPVKANLVEEWQDWQHSFYKPEFKNDFM